jgi:hypothetical protein
MSVSINYILYTGYSFLLGFVSEHGSSDDIANGPDAWDLSLQVVVDFDHTALVSNETCLFKLEPTSEGATTSGDKNNVRFESSSRTALSRLNFYFAAIRAA